MAVAPSPFSPAGDEREVRLLGGTAIDGAPVAYIVVLSAVVTTLAFIPFTVVLASGGSFPMSQGIFALLGFLMGPIAGAVARGIGTLIGVFVAPHTAGIWPVSLLGAAVTSFAAGSFAGAGRRRWLPLPVALVALAALGFYLGRAVLVVGIPLRTAILGSILDWSALLMFVSPLRTLVARLIQSPSMARVAVALGLGTWMAFGMAHAVQDSLTYYVFNWPEKIWVMLIPIIPVEMLFRCAVGMVIGTGVISGLRAIGLVRPTHAKY
jgi:hypothetical protein